MRIVAPSSQSSVKIVGLTASAGTAERAQDLKLRRRASSAGKAGTAVAPAVVAKRSGEKESSQVVPVVRYETVRVAATTQSKREVDVFSDPFGDEADTRAQPARKPASTRPTTKAVREAARLTVEEMNPFGDEPIERIVQQPLPERIDPAAPSNEREQLVPSFEETVAQGPQARLAPCPSPDSLKRIREIKADIRSTSDDLPPECTLGDSVYEPRQFAATTYHWKASALCHKPLYFEDVPLERYGHSWGPVLQPLVSAGKFFLTLPILPYEMGIEPPCECVYVLGYYRPGSCAPYMIFPVPLSIRGGMVEAGAVVGAVFLIP